MPNPRGALFWSVTESLLPSLDMHTRFPARAVRAGAAVVAIVIVGLALRMHGIAFGLPHMTEPDGKIILSQVELIRRAEPEPQRFDDWVRYPHLLARVAAIVPGGNVLAASELPAATTAEQLADASAPHVHLRRIAAWLSLAILPATWFLARRFLGVGGSLLATAWLSTSLLHVWFSQEARPHGPAATMALLAVLAAMKLRERPTLPVYLAAGIAAGLAIGTLQSGLAVLVPLLVAHVMVARARGVRFWLPATAGLALAFGVCAALYPFVFARSGTIPTSLFELRGEELLFFGHSVFIERFDGSGFACVLGSLWCFEPVMSVLAAAAIACAAPLRARWRSNPDVWIAASYFVPYFLVVGMYARAFERFALQLLPYVAVLAAAASALGFRWLLARGVPRAALVTAAMLVALVPSIPAVRLVALRGRSDTATLAARWLEEHADPERDRVLLLPPCDLPLARSATAREGGMKVGWLTPWMSYQLRAGEAATAHELFDVRNLSLGTAEDRASIARDPIAHFRGQGARYVVGVALDNSYPVPLRAQMRDDLAARATLALRLPPDAAGDASDTPLLYAHQLVPHQVPWAYLLATGAVTMFGPVVEIYRLL